MSAATIDTAKKVGKVAVTVLVVATSPIWILPFLAICALVLVGAGLHESLWGDRRQRNERGY